MFIKLVTRRNLFSLEPESGKPPNPISLGSPQHFPLYMWARTTTKNTVIFVCAARRIGLFIKKRVVIPVCPGRVVLAAVGTSLNLLSITVRRRTFFMCTSTVSKEQNNFYLRMFGNSASTASTLSIPTKFPFLSFYCSPVISSYARKNSDRLSWKLLFRIVFSWTMSMSLMQW